MRFKDGMMPSDFMRRNVYHSFQEDALGIQMRHVIGVENLMWGSDYPHSESTFPKSLEILDEILEGVPEEEKAMIVGGERGAGLRVLGDVSGKSRQNPPEGPLASL